MQSDHYIKNLNDLIAELQDIQSKYGDIPVVIANPENNWSAETPTKTDIHDSVVLKDKARGFRPPYFRLVHFDINWE